MRSATGSVGSTTPASPACWCGRFASRYTRPNFQARLSSRLVAAGIQQPVDETAPVRDTILGTAISGTGRTVGKLGVRLIPNPNQAELETVLSGTVSTRTVGYNGPATIHASGVTDVVGRKRIVFDEKGLASYPATATAKTRTRINGVAAGRGGLVQRIATDRVYESKSQAEAIGAQHAAARVRQRVEKQAATQLGKAHWDYVNKLRNPLLRRREFPAVLKLSTTEADLLLTALQANRYQLGAADQGRRITVENDIALQLHESMANNLAQALLGGVTLKEEEVQKQAIDMLGKLPEQLKSEEDRDPWSITFAKVRPVTVKFFDDGFQVTVHRSALYFRRPRLSGHERDGRLQDRDRWQRIEGCPAGRTAHRAAAFRGGADPAFDQGCHAQDTAAAKIW